MTTVLGILLAALVYGSAVEPRVILDVEHEPAPIPYLPAAWVGEEIAVIADLQVGMWWANLGMMERAVEYILDARPAVALIAGDFIYKPDETPEELIEKAVAIVRPLPEAGIPTYAVLGNHDWGLNVKDGTINREAARKLEEALESAGVPVLRNEVVALRDPTGSLLHLVGIGSEWAGHADPYEALRELPDTAPRLVFMHNPNSFPELPPYSAPVAVAGHTHAGQVRIPFLPQWTCLTFTSEDEVHADGWIEEEYGAPGNRLYVNRGIGFSVAPIRINAPPEVTIFTLQPGEADPRDPPREGLSSDPE